MTAEIAIMNREAVALAADSAVTSSRGLDRKIFTSANKLFALSKYHPIGILVYDNANLMGVPWETIIKIYREKLGKKNFDTINDYANDFITFLDEKNPIFTENAQKEHFKEMISQYFNYVRGNCIKEMQSVIDKKGSIDDDEVVRIANITIGKSYEIFTDAKSTPSLGDDFGESVSEKYDELIDTLINKIFEKLPISKETLKKLRGIASRLSWKFPRGLRAPFNSGVVIAGFGKKEIFPALKSFFMEIVVNNRLKYMHDNERKIGNGLSSSIVPFAQKDVVATFMNGIDPDREKIENGLIGELFRNFVEKTLTGLEGVSDGEKDLLKEKLQKEGKERLLEYTQKINIIRQTRYIQPVMNVITMMPKDELALVAETFVSLTSFKRKVSMQSETVGGDVDVAVISKGDGFVWIKRKHYFKPELNPQFFSRYWKEGNDGE